MTVEVPDFFAVYDDLAVDIVADDRLNTDTIGLPISNADMCYGILKIMDWETFDLLETIPFEDVYANGPLSNLLAYSYLAFLRWDLFVTALHENIGDEKFNILASTFSEYWYMKLRDKHRALCNDQKTKHHWIH